MCAQLDRPECDAYLVPMDAMTEAGPTLRVAESIAAFGEKRGPVWTD